jgi:hypothetical protein
MTATWGGLSLRYSEPHTYAVNDAYQGQDQSDDKEDPIACSEAGLDVRKQGGEGCAGYSNANPMLSD